MIFALYDSWEAGNGCNFVSRETLQLLQLSRTTTSSHSSPKRASRQNVEGEKDKIEAAIKELEETLKGTDKAAIDAKTEALATASQKLGEKVYADMQAKGEAGGAEQAAAGAHAGAQAGQGAPHDDNVVDAEFKEVNDKK